MAIAVADPASGAMCWSVPNACPGGVAVNDGSSRALWLCAALTSIGLLLAVLFQVDWAMVGELVVGVPISLLLFALLGFGLEGVFTALRIRSFATGRASVAASFKVTAWFVLWLVVLPARLGEIAATLLMGRHLRMRTGQAAAALLLQRLLDLAVLCFVCVALIVVLRAPAATSLTNPLSSPRLLTLLLAMLGGLVATGCWLHRPLGLVGRAMLTRGRRTSGIWRTVLRLVLSARVYHRHRLSLPLVLQATMLTVGKWTCHLGAFAVLLHALAMPLSPPTSILLGAGYNCLAVIPLQTIGGFGISEAGLLGLLTLFDVPLQQAASTAILVRVVLVVAPVLFWAVVLLFVGGAKRDVTTP